MTMNGAVLPILALYIVAAEEQGVPPRQAVRAPSRTTSSRSSWSATPTSIRPGPRCGSSRTSSPTPREQMPKFNSISISGYHMQEAGATADLELAYTLADGIEYVRAGVAAGHDVDQFAPRLSLLLGHRHELLHGGGQAARRPPAVGQADEATSSTRRTPRSLSLRAHCQTSGWSLAAQDVFNNVARTAVEAMAAAGGQTQSLHTNSLDEALALPTDFSARIARNTQLFLQMESGLTRVIDPWGGSYYVERLTHDLAARAPGAHRRGRGAGRHGQGHRGTACPSCASRRPRPAPRRASTPAADRRRREPLPSRRRRRHPDAEGRQRRRARRPDRQAEAPARRARRGAVRRRRSTP